MDQEVVVDQMVLILVVQEIHHPYLLHKVNEVVIILILLIRVELVVAEQVVKEQINQELLLELQVVQVLT